DLPARLQIESGGQRAGKVVPYELAQEAQHIHARIPPGFLRALPVQVRQARKMGKGNSRSDTYLFCLNSSSMVWGKLGSVNQGKSGPPPFISWTNRPKHYSGLEPCNRGHSSADA